MTGNHDVITGVLKPNLKVIIGCYNDAKICNNRAITTVITGNYDVIMK